MPSVKVRLDIAADEMLLWYKGVARDVVAWARDGRRVQFPASILQEFVQKDGVHGDFELTYDDRGRFVQIRRLPPRPGGASGSGGIVV